MSNYSKLTNFATKDSLASGNPLKVIKGTEIDDEFEAIETAIGTKADSASPTFTGTPVAPTASSGTNTTQIATTAFVTTAINAIDTNVVADTTPQLGGALDANSNNIDMGTAAITYGTSAWSMAISGTDLVFSYNGTAKIKFASDGEIVTVDDVTGFGTI